MPGSGFSLPAAGRTSVEFNQRVIYAPAVLSRLFPVATLPTLGDVPSASQNYNVNAADSYSSATSLSLTRGFKRKWSVSVAGDVHYTAFTHNVDYENARSYGLAPHLTYEWNRNTRLLFNYTAVYNLYGRLNRTIFHTVEAGFSYDRALSVRRSTSLMFVIGPIVQQRIDSHSVDPTQAYLTGVAANAMFARQFTRTWSVEAGAARSVQFPEVIATPVITNGATLKVAGRVAPRIDILLGSSYTTGQNFIGTTSAHLSTYSSEFTTRIALTRTTMLTLQYLRYQYDFTELPPLITGIPPSLTRNGARVGIMTALPVWRR